MYYAVVSLKEAFAYTCIWLVGLRAKRYSIISMVRMLKYENAHTVTVGLVYVLLEKKKNFFVCNKGLYKVITLLF